MGGGVRTPLCGFVKDSAGKNARSCVDVVVDNSPGTVTLKDTGGNIFTGATSSTTIVVQGDDTDSGIDRIVLVQTSGGSYSSTSTVSGVQTSAQATFPTSGSLSDGVYAALVYNLSGVASQAGFTRERPSFLVGAQLRDVCRNPASVSLNFWGGSLLYRQAGRLSELV